MVLPNLRDLSERHGDHLYQIKYIAWNNHRILLSSTHGTETQLIPLGNALYRVASAELLKPAQPKSITDTAPILPCTIISAPLSFQCRIRDFQRLKVLAELLHKLATFPELLPITN